MPKTVIRRATPADFPVLLDIDTRSFDAGVAYDSIELSYFMNRPGSATLVLEDEGQIAAFLIVEIRRTARTATLITLDVLEGSRRKGFATQLLQSSEELLSAAGVRIYTLQVDVDNEAAIAFYKKHGFEISRILRNYYSNGHDAYLMVKTFEG